MDLREPLGGPPPATGAETTGVEERDKTSMVRSLVGRSRAFRLVYEQIERAAGSDVPVLLYGETGTGKELAAQAIHEMSARRKGPFVRVHTAQIPKDQVEMVLAGARAGAKPDIAQDVKGKLEEAN